MAKRKPKPEPISTAEDATALATNALPAAAEAHAPAASVTDPSAFEFPFGAAAEPPAGEVRTNPEPAAGGAARSYRESVEADGRHTFTFAAEALGDRVFPASELPPKPPTSDAGRTPDPAGEDGRPWKPVFGSRGDYEAGVKLLEDRRFKQMQLKFDAKPSDGVRQLVRDAGYQWRPAEQAWTKQIDPEHAWRIRAEADSLFDKLTAMIREERGPGESRDAGRHPG